jgi:ABC-2 type transport system permease protein
MTTSTSTGTMTSTMTGTMTSTRAELLRLRKWPAVWITIGAWLGLTVLFGYAFNYVSYTSGNNSFSNEGVSRGELLAELLPGNAPHVLIDGMPMFGGALMMLLGALVAGSGYSWGTWKTVFTQGPSRASAAAGSLAALTVFVVITVLASLAVCFGLSLVVAGTQSQTVVWPALDVLARSVGSGLVVMEMWALLGFLLGTVARGPALSVGLALVWVLVVENLLRGVGTLLGAVEAFTKVLPGTGAGSLVGSIVGTGPDPAPGVVDTLSGGQALVVLVAYLVLIPVLAVWLMARRDVA